MYKTSLFGYSTVTPIKAAGTVLGQQGQSKTKGHFFHFKGHFKGQKISRAKQDIIPSFKNHRI